MRGQKKAAKRLDDATPRDSMYGSATAWLSGKPAWAQKAAKGGVAAIAAAAVAASVAFGVSRALRPAEAPPENPSPEIEAAPSRAAGEAPEASRFINLEAYGFLGDAARASFVREFSTHLAAQGVPEGEFVMCYSRVEGDGEACTAWASCPNGERFWQISYDLASKAFSFEALEGVPDGLPEINYEALRAAAERESDEVPNEAAEKPDAPLPEARPQEQGTAPGGVTLDDVAGLREILPDEAAEDIAEAIVEGALREYGFAVDAASSTVEQGTIERAGETCSFTVFCRNLQGEALSLRVEYDEATGSFAGRRM